MLEQKKRTLVKKQVKKHEQTKALKDSEVRYRRIFEAAQHGILILNAKTGQITDINPHLMSILGCTHEELIGKKLWEISPLKEIVASKESLAKLQKQECLRFDNLTLQTRDNGTINVEVVSSPYQVNRQKLIQCIIHDITTYKEIENKLEEARQDLEMIKQSEDEALEYAESIINTVHEPLVILDKDLRIVSASRSFYKVFNVNPEETVGQLIYTLSDKQWNIPKLQDLLETILPQKTTLDNYEVDYYLPNLGRRIMLLNARQIQREAEKEQIILLAIEDITARKELENTLKKLNAAKSDLLANVSHELRTPLSSIKGFIETLIETDVKWTKKQQINFLQMANIEVDRLVYLINDLLVMSKIDSGKIVLDKENYNLGEILESAGSILSRITSKHQLKIKLMADLPLICVDKIKITQVITNLVENATKFSPEGSQITIEATLIDGNVTVGVLDRGIGMSPEVLANLFERFYQAEQVVSGKTKGTGLGLAICKGIVEAHGGKIWVESQEGKGSKFYFSIPITKMSDKS